MAAIPRAGLICEGRTRLKKAFLCFALKKNKNTNNHIDFFQKRIHTGTTCVPRILCALRSKFRNTGKMCAIALEKCLLQDKSQQEKGNSSG